MTLGAIIRRYGEAYRTQFSPPPLHLKVLDAIANCRTSALGGHAWVCRSCGGVHVHYNSCGNRHCPACQAFEKEKWVEKRQQELLPVPYLHLVFTLPHQLNPLILSNDRLCYNLLFKAAWETIAQLSSDKKWLGAQTGMLAVLHTWGSNLSFHPHLHCVLPTGGLNKQQTKWILTRNKRFFAPNKKVIAPIFKAIFLKHLQAAYENEALVFFGEAEDLADFSAFKKLFLQVHSINWNVYAKRPFGSPANLLNYLSRYTHRIAISNQRIAEVKDGRVIFSAKNYRKKDEKGAPLVEQTSLKIMEFIRRFLLHVLPKGFQRIRYFGLLAIRNRQTKLKQAQNLLNHHPTCITPLHWKQRLLQLTGQDVDACRFCGQKTLLFLGNLPQQSVWSGRSPPTKVNLITPEGEVIPLTVPMA